MSKQLTLTGYVAHDHASSHIYSKVTNSYEHFVERYYRRNKSTGKSRREIVEDAQQMWKHVRSDKSKIEAFLALRPGEIPILQSSDPPHQQIKIRDFGFYEVVDQDGIAVVDDASGSGHASSHSRQFVPDGIGALEDRDKFIHDQRFSQVAEMVSILCSNCNQDLILSEDVCENSDFITIASSSARSYLSYGNHTQVKNRERGHHNFIVTWTVLLNLRRKSKRYC